ncbi:hypothetical protein LF65_05340 [Clostridium beijerinckii]|uniref:DUF1700 domain-containing protein n=1 Tax=Clostridium beijerinckii TaxID=1520 RepID=A0A0B5QLV4_CLOBE|nr:DUF1700 domain-containing protein [Clostridium beijerinckii]AJH01861.1 hypothetical protein LF65_05340 [Clostridium beijerinckii]
MTQNEFFNILMDGLKDFPEIKLQDIISYYENYFKTRLTVGRTEDDIAKELGDPNLIVNKLRNEHLHITITLDNLTNNASTETSDEISNIDATDVSTDNKHINACHNFKTNKKFSNIYSENKNDLKTDSNFNDFKSNNSYASNDCFYDLHNENISLDIQKSNYKCAELKESKYNINNENNFKRSNHISFISEFNFNMRQIMSIFNNKSKNKISNFNINIILKFFIVILSLVIFFPVITGVIGCFIGLLGIAISIFIASIGVLIGGTFTNLFTLPNIPAFVSNFPYPVIVLFSLGSLSLSLLLMIIFFYLCKFLILILAKTYKFLKFKGGESL